MPQIRPAPTQTAAPVCGGCRQPLQRHIFYGELRFYVCRGCGRWAVPFPPARPTGLPA